MQALHGWLDKECTHTYTQYSNASLTCTRDGSQKFIQWATCTCVRSHWSINSTSCQFSSPTCSIIIDRVTRTTVIAHSSTWDRVVQLLNGLGTQNDPVAPRYISQSCFELLCFNAQWLMTHFAYIHDFLRIGVWNYKRMSVCAIYLYILKIISVITQNVLLNKRVFLIHR